MQENSNSRQTFHPDKLPHGTSLPKLYLVGLNSTKSVLKAVFELKLG